MRKLIVQVDHKMILLFLVSLSCHSLDSHLQCHVMIFWCQVRGQILSSVVPVPDMSVTDTLHCHGLTPSCMEESLNTTTQKMSNLSFSFNNTELKNISILNINRNCNSTTQRQETKRTTIVLQLCSYIPHQNHPPPPPNYR